MAGVFGVEAQDEPAAGGGRGAGGDVGRGGTWAEEEVTVGCLRLLLAHGQVGHVPPAELRRFLRRALARFPCRCRAALLHPASPCCSRCDRARARAGAGASPETAVSV